MIDITQNIIDIRETATSDGDYTGSKISELPDIVLHSAQELKRRFDAATLEVLDPKFRANVSLVAQTLEDIERQANEGFALKEKSQELEDRVELLESLNGGGSEKIWTGSAGAGDMISIPQGKLRDIFGFEIDNGVFVVARMRTTGQDRYIAGEGSAMTSPQISSARSKASIYLYCPGDGYTFNVTTIMTWQEDNYLSSYSPHGWSGSGKITAVYAM